MSHAARKVCVVGPVPLVVDDEEEFDDEELDEELDDVQCIEELATGAAGDTERSTVPVAASVSGTLPGFLLLRSLDLLADIALISIAICLL